MPNLLQHQIWDSPPPLLQAKQDQEEGDLGRGQRGSCPPALTQAVFSAEGDVREWEMVCERWNERDRDWRGPPETQRQGQMEMRETPG